MSSFTSHFTRRDFLGMAGAASLGGCASGSQAPASKAPESTVPANQGTIADKGLTTQDLPAFPTNFHADRIDRLRRAMAAQNVDAVFLGPTVNLTYFTGVRWGVSERLFGCIVFREDPLVWISPKFEARRAKESVNGLGELHTWQEWEDPHTLLHALLLTRSGADTIAMDSHLRATHVLRLTQRLREGDPNSPSFIVNDGLPVTAAVRSVKSDPELARIRRACEITQKAIQSVKDKVLEPGVTEAEATAAVNEAQREMGLTNCWALVLFGANASFPHGTKNRIPLVKGDMALFDCGGELEHYQSDISRTYFIGDKPTDEQRKVYSLVRQAQKEALAAARPSVTCQEVDRAARAVIVQGGYGPDATFFTHRLGHGIGLEGHEDPYFCEGNTTVLAPGMTLSNEPGIYIPGRLGVRIEDIVVITPHGAESLGMPAADQL